MLIKEGVSMVQQLTRLCVWNRMLLSQRRAQVEIAGAILVLGVVTGCGGTRMAPPSQSSALTVVAPARHATAHLNIKWPPATSRSIPAGSNRIVFYVNGANPQAAGQVGTFAYIIDRTTTTATAQSALIDIPVGNKLLFSVVARIVPSPNPAFSSVGPVVPVSLTSPALTEGVATAFGNDGVAHIAVGVGDQVSANVTLGLAATPPSATMSAAISINQVLTGAFPSVVSLQIIRDQDGNPIKDLNVGNFTVEEDGQSAVITDVRTVQEAAQTLAVALVLDRSGSMADYGKNDGLLAAATQFASLLQAGDVAEVINFSDTVNVSQSFTSDKTLLDTAITGTSPGGNTALYDAIVTGISEAAGIKGRSAVIALTDGIENASYHTQSDVINAASSQNVPVFTIGLGNDADTATLQAIAASSGGTYTFAPSGADLDHIYKAINSQLDGQIQISFISPNPVASGTLRHLKIKLQYGTLKSETDTDYRL
jgi:VWFA-related protein